MCNSCERPCVRDGGERECTLSNREWAYEMGDITLLEYLRGAEVEASATLDDGEGEGARTVRKLGERGDKDNG